MPMAFTFCSFYNIIWSNKFIMKSFPNITERSDVILICQLLEFQPTDGANSCTGAGESIGDNCIYFKLVNNNASPIMGYLVL